MFVYTMLKNCAFFIADAHSCQFFSVQLSVYIAIASAVLQFLAMHHFSCAIDIKCACKWYLLCCIFRSTFFCLLTYILMFTHIRPSNVPWGACDKLCFDRLIQNKQHHSMTTGHLVSYHLQVAIHFNYKTERLNMLESSIGLFDSVITACKIDNRNWIKT